MNWQIVSFKSVGPIRYGMTEDDVLQRFGKPDSKRTSPRLEYHYDGFTVRFSEIIKVDEVSFFDYAPENDLFWEEHKLDWDGRFMLDLCVLDGEPREKHGYIYLLNLGIALVDFFDEATGPVITVFEARLEKEKQFPLLDMGELKCRMQDFGVLK